MIPFSVEFEEELWALRGDPDGRQVGPAGRCRHYFWHNRHIETPGTRPQLGIFKGIVGILGRFMVYVAVFWVRAELFWHSLAIHLRVFWKLVGIIEHNCA